MLHTEVLEPSTLDILRAISKANAFADFCLVGGTALALQFGHRLSEDLDFFSATLFDKELIKFELQDIGNWHTDSENKIGLRGKLNGIKTDFVTYRYPYIQPVTVIDGIRMLSLADISAMKLSAITNRGVKKDFYDVFFLLKQYSFPQLCDWYRQKFETNNLFMLFKSITYFDDAEQSQTPILLAAQNTSWAIIKQTLLDEVNKYA
jgi:predicted nucleotidyltransferase component of viral defense system